MRLLYPAMLLVLLSSASADAESGTCVNTDGSSCQRRASHVIADYAPDLSEDEEEDENDGDLIMHIQAKLVVDKAIDDSEAKPAHPHRKETHETTPKLSLHGAAASAAAPAGQQQAAASPLSLLEIEEAQTVTEVLESDAEDTEGSAGVFLTGYQMLIGTGIAALLVIIGALFAIVLRSSLMGKGTFKEEVNAAAQAYLLKWALGYEPEEVEEVKEPVQEEMQVRTTKKAPPVYTESDSGDTDEEEPEAESDSQFEGDSRHEREIELLQNALFVAEQVEMSNQAIDHGYGMDEQRPLVDLIRAYPVQGVP